MNAIEELNRELDYLLLCTEQDAAKILKLDLQNMAMRMEIERKRRGFALIAEVSVSLGEDSDLDRILASLCMRINQSLNMQRTVLMTPDGEGAFSASVIRGYTAGEEAALAERKILLEDELLDSRRPVLVTGADPKERLAEFRRAIGIPYFVSCPVVLRGKITAVLAVGRTIEQMPWMPRLGASDMETVQIICAYIASVQASKRLLEAEERMRLMFDATPLCCNFWDENFANVDCNEEAARLFGLSSKQEYLDRFNELSPERQPNGRLSSEMSREMVSEAFEKGSNKFKWMHCKPNGDPIPTEVTLVRIKRGDRYNVAGYTRDLRADADVE